MDKPSGGLVGPRVGEEIRCPSCARLLVLRSGPAVTPHYAHRPRQSCRNRPGRPRSGPLRLEQLTLFELEPPAHPHPDTHSGSPTPPPLADPAARSRPTTPPPDDDPFASSGPAPALGPPDPPGLDERSGVEAPRSTAAPRRRRRRAWLPRLIRWVRAKRR